MKKVFLDDLPRRNIYKNKTTAGIDWANCIGCKVPFIYDDIKGEMSIIGCTYCNKTYKLRLLWNGREAEIYISHLINCHLGKLLGKVTNEFKIKIGTHFKDEKRDIIIIDRKVGVKDYSYGKYTTKYYKYKCNKCGFDCSENYVNGECREEYWIAENHLLNDKSGCACCSNKTTVKGINDIQTTDNWMVELGVDKQFATHYTYSSANKIICICPFCNNERYKRISDIYNDKSIGCTCGDGFSYPEKFMYSLLTQLNVEFITQYSPHYLGLKKSDFYIPGLNLIIETDGGIGHEGGKTHSKSNRTIEELVEIDNWKDKQHKLHGLHTIRINCFESNHKYIKENILKSELVNYFDLSDINWNSVDKFAWFSNLRKQVCEYWDNKQEYENTTDLAKVFNLARCTIRKYLKKGNELEWCSYNAKKELKSIGKINGKMRGKPVEIFKDSVSLGVFPSCAELERQSEELFGVKLYNSGISRICLQEPYKSYKGFTFKYIEDNKNCA